jgi:hypothetical protein
MPVVSGKVLGRRRPLFADWAWPLPASLGQGSVSLKSVLEAIVRDQVRAFQKRQADNQILRALTAKQIDEAAERGRITMGQSEVGRQAVDEDAAVATARQAFEDGLFLVVVNGVELKRLDEVIALTDDSRITFIRLTLLAGG